MLSRFAIPSLREHHARPQGYEANRFLLNVAGFQAPPSGWFWAPLNTQNGAILVRIANTGSELSQEEAEQVFARFWRGDSARKDTGLHCGLGLSLAKRIMTMLGGSIQAESQAGGVFTIELTLPDN